MRKNLLVFFALNFVIFYGLAAARAYNIPQKILGLLGDFLGTVGIVENSIQPTGAKQPGTL